MQANNITFGFSDSEDRLWARVQLQNNSEAHLWLTRRLTLAACHGIVQVIEKNTFENGQPLSEDLLNKYLRREFFEITQTTWDPAPAAPNTSQTPTADINPSGLCHTIKIDGGNVWQIQLIGPQQQTYVLPLDRRLMQKILLALLKQMEVAQWGGTPVKPWLTHVLPTS